MARLAQVLVALGSATAAADFMDHFVVREDVGVHKAPSLGNAELLVMPVEVAGHPPLDMARLKRFFSADDPDGFVRFYQTASLGRYQPHVTVGPKIAFDSCPLPAATFPGCAVRRGDIAAFAAGLSMIREVVKRSAAAGVDFSTLDVNGRKGVPDGWADGVMLITNVPFGGIAFPFGYFNRDDNLDGGTGGPLIVNGVKVTHVAIAGEGNPFVMVHEFGHLLGLTDLYDESGVYAGLYLSTMGAWSYDANIVLPDAESRFRLRWATWHQVQGRQRVVIHPVETSGDVYRLGIGDEYFLVENRGPGDFDRSLPVRGLAVFKVDRKVKLRGDEGAFVNRLLDCVNCDPWHPYVRMMQADGAFQIERNGRFDAAGDLFREGARLVPDQTETPFSKASPVNSTNLYGGAKTGLAIDDLRALSNGDLEVTLEAPETSQCDDRLCAGGDGCAPVDCGVVGAPKSGCSAVPWTLAPAALVLLLLLEQGLRRLQRR